MNYFTVLPVYYLFKVDYLTVEHDVGINFDPEMILIGQNLETSISGLRRNNYTIAKLKSSQELDEKSIQLQDLGQHNYMASIQFEKPFDYRLIDSIQFASDLHEPFSMNELFVLFSVR